MQQAGEQAGRAPGAAADGAVGAGVDAGAAPGDLEPATGVNDLSPACFVAVFRKLGAAETARAMCVHPLWAEALRDDILWRDHLGCVYAQRAPTLPSGGAAPSHRASFLAWTAHFAGLPQGFVSRALHVWERLSAWTAAHAPFIADSLRPGATSAAVAEAEAALGVKLPPALAAVLRVHDGQALEFDQRFDRYMAWRMRQQQQGDAGGGDEDAAGQEQAPPPPPRWHPSMVWGLFGGYAFYDHLASLRLFPLERIVRWTRFFRSHPHAQLPRQLLVVGASANLGKLLLADAATGDLRVGGAQEHMPAAPRPQQNPTGGGPSACGGGGDASLRWVEEWAARLEGGWYEVRPLGVDRHAAPGISLFPAVAPHLATAVTRGLQVRVSAVFAPEMCGDGGSRYFFAYSVRFSLLSAEEQRRRAAAEAGARAGGESGRGAAPGQPADGGGSSGDAGMASGAGSGSRVANGENGLEEGSGSGAGASAGPSGGGAGGAAAAPPAPAFPPASFQPLRRCQLESRQWRILGQDGSLANEVSGEGVVGLYPALEAGGPEVAYQSCTHQADLLGFMEGGFTFVEGSLARPEGPAFMAACPRFELRVPEFVY